MGYEPQGKKKGMLSIFKNEVPLLALYLKLLASWKLAH